MKSTFIPFFKKITFFSIALLSISSHYCISSTSDRLSRIQVYKDSASFQSVGYNDSYIQGNGELHVIRNIIYGNDVVFDVGANKGDWTNLILQNHSLVSIYAFEPIKEVFEVLTKSVNPRQTTCFNLAISDKNELKDFFYYPTANHSELSGLYFRPILEKLLSNSQPVKRKIPTQSLDSFCDQHGLKHINFLKIDTEGAELDVLKGAIGLLQNLAVDVIQFEYGGTYLDSKTTLKQVYELLRKNNYTVYRIISAGLVELTQWHEKLENYQYSNYLAFAKGN